jgi:hypothetical protein
MSSPFVFAQRPVGFVVPITANTVTTVIDATSNAVTITDFEINETGGGTQNLTVELYDGTNSRYLSDDAGTTWKAKAVTAYKGYKFTRVVVVDKGSKLRVTSSDASGNFHVVGNKLLN